METWAHDSISFEGSCVIMLSVLFSGIILLQILAIVMIFFVTDYELFPLEHRSSERFLNGGPKYIMFSILVNTKGINR